MAPPNPLYSLDRWPPHLDLSAHLIYLRERAGAYVYNPLPSPVGRACSIDH